MTIPRGNQLPPQRGGQSRQRERNGLPYLSKREATTTPAPGKIIETRVVNDPFKVGEQMVVLKINYRTALWLFNLRPNSPILASLVEAFGDDETTWRDRDVMIYNQEDDFDHRVWLVIEPADTPGSNVPQTTPPVKRSRKNA